MLDTTRLLTAGVWAGVACAALVIAGCPEAPAGAPDRDSTGCLQTACHGGVEQIHYGGAALGCATCHGGDPTAVTREGGHVTVSTSFNPSVPNARVLDEPTLAEMDELDPAVLRFLNPGDLRVAMQTCGSTTLRGGNCHERITGQSLRSTHATMAGQLAGGLYFLGAGAREGRFSPARFEDPFYTGAEGTVGGLDHPPIEVPGTAPNDADFAASTWPILRMGCTADCHLMRDGPKAPGMYYSSGCNACHMVTAPNTRPETADVTQRRDEPGHPGQHQLTNRIPDAQCAACHHAHLARSLLIQGVRERSNPDGDEEIMAELGEDRINRGVEEPENVVPWGEDNYVRWQGKRMMFGKPYPYYIEDEDGTDDVDSTPPSIHLERGMACIDCHTMGELHGDDKMYDSMYYEIRTRCETCHGQPTSLDDPDDAVIDVDRLPLVRAGTRQGTNGDNPRVAFYDASDDRYKMLLKLNGLERNLTQIGRVVNPDFHRHNPRTLMGCGLHAGTAQFRAALAEEFEATPPEERAERFPGMPEDGTLPEDFGERDGRMECFACHNAWTTNCYGCHMVRDDRGTQRDPVDGSDGPSMYTFAMSVVADGLALGFSTRGRIAPMVGTSIFFTHFDEDGNRVQDARPMEAADGSSGDGHVHSPVNHHTTQKRPRPCEACHPRADQPERPAEAEEVLRRATGFGTGQFRFTDGNGRVHLLDRLVRMDWDGDGEWEDPLTAGPMPSAITGSEAIAGNPHKPVGASGDGPAARTLDLDTINRMLGNPVVPQVFPEVAP